MLAPGGIFWDKRGGSCGRMEKHRETESHQSPREAHHLFMECNVPALLPLPFTSALITLTQRSANTMRPIRDFNKIYLSLAFLSLFPFSLVWVDTPYALSSPQWVCFSELRYPMMLITLAAHADQLQPVGGLWPAKALIAKHRGSHAKKQPLLCRSYFKALNTMDNNPTGSQTPILA